MAKANHKHSILQGKEKHCYITGAAFCPLEKHHIYFGPGLRKISDKHGFWVWLTPEFHRGTNGVHGKNGHTLDLMLKQEVQKAYEEKHGHEAWMKLVGRSYL
ncbi:hypothetical protein [Anaerotignum sp.]